MEEKKEEIKKENKGKKGSKGLIILLVVLGVLVALGVIGKIYAGKVKDKAFSVWFSHLLSKTGTGNVNFEDNGKKVTYEGEEGNFSYEQSDKLPDNWPNDFPIYPGVKIEGSSSMESEGTKGVSVVWESDDSVDEVAEFYKKELPLKGWTVTSSFTQDESSTFSFNKGESEGILGMTRKDTGKTSISATIGVK